MAVCHAGSACVLTGSGNVGPGVAQRHQRRSFKHRYILEICLPKASRQHQGKLALTKFIASDEIHEGAWWVG
jgi:hypothetical protein